MDWSIQTIRYSLLGHPKTFLPVYFLGGPFDPYGCVQNHLVSCFVSFMVLQLSVLLHPFSKIWPVKFLHIAEIVLISKDLLLSERLLLFKRSNSAKELNEYIHVSQMYARAHTYLFKPFQGIWSHTLFVIKHTILYIQLNIFYERLKESYSNILFVIC